MSTTQRQVFMESLGRLEVNPSPADLGVSLAPRISGGPPAIEKCLQRSVAPQGQAHLNGCVPLTHQVAGHKYGVDKVGILQHPDGTVLKQLQPPPRGPRELQFYSMVYAKDCCDQCLLELQNHLPKYYGTWSPPDSPNDLYLKLEDVTRRFVKPCIMDVKLGQQSYDPFASQEKREQQIRKYPLMEEMGFLVLGMRVYNVCSDTFDSYDQHYGRGLVKDTVKDGLANFFHNGVSLRKDAVLASVRRVQHILRWFESQQQLNFYASSLLFVYEGLHCPSALSNSAKISSLSSSDSNTPGDRGHGGEVKTRTVAGHDDEQEEEEEEEEEDDLVEHNNNNFQVSSPWDCSLPAVYTKLPQGDKGHYTQDNSTWKRPPCRNGNKLLAEEDTTEEVQRKEEGKKVTGRGGAPGEAGVEVRMIDFAHVFPSESPDHGYIFGLRHLLTVLEQILREASLAP